MGNLICPVDPGSLSFDDAIQRRLNIIKKVNWKDINYPECYECPPPIFNDKRNIILDTDFASDIDSIWALLFLMHITDNYQLKGIVTVSGPVEVRKAIAEMMIHSMNNEEFKKVPIIAGMSNPLTGDPNDNLEGEYLFDPNQLEALKEKSSDDYTKVRDPVGWYVNTLKNLPSDEKATIIVIGPLTNLAYLYLNHEDLAREKIDRLVILGAGLCMYPYCEKDQEENEKEEIPTKKSAGGQKEKVFQASMKLGEAYSNEPTKNILKDIQAANIVIGNATKWKQTLQFITNEVDKTKLNATYLKSLFKVTQPEELKFVMNLVKKMKDSNLKERDKSKQKEIENTFGSIAIFEGLFPGVSCNYRKGWLYVHEKLGYTKFIPDPNDGPCYGAAQMKDTVTYNKFIESCLAKSYSYEDMYFALTASPEV